MHNGRHSCRNAWVLLICLNDEIGETAFATSFICVFFRERTFYCVKKMKADNVVKLAEKAGLKAIEWSEHHHIRPGDAKEAMRIASIMEDCNLEVASYGSYFRLSSGMDIIPSLDTAEALGARTVRIWGGSKPSRKMTDRERLLMADEALRAADAASGYGMTLALEWHRDTVTDTNESAIGFLNMVGHPNLKSFWQPTPGLSMKERIEGLNLLGERLVNIHTYYWQGEDRLPLKDGEKYWKEYLEHIRGDHYMLLEFVKDDSVSQFMEDSATLKEWTSSMN